MQPRPDPELRADEISSDLTRSSPTDPSNPDAGDRASRTHGPFHGALVLAYSWLGTALVWAVVAGLATLAPLAIWMALASDSELAETVFIVATIACGLFGVLKAERARRSGSLTVSSSRDRSATPIHTARASWILDAGH